MFLGVFRGFPMIFSDFVGCVGNVSLIGFSFFGGSRLYSLIFWGGEILDFS